MFIHELQKQRQKIEDYKIEAYNAERTGDYGKVAEIRYGKMAQAQIKDLQEKLSENGVTIEFTEGFEEHMSTKGYEPAYGARPIKRLMQKELVNLLPSPSLSMFKTVRYS